MHSQHQQQASLGQLLETEEAFTANGSSKPSHVETTAVTTCHSTVTSLMTSDLSSSISSAAAISTSLTTSGAISNSTSTVASTSGYLTNSWSQESASSQALDEAMAQLDDELEMSGSSAFQRSLSLPRGFGKTNAQGLEVEAVPSTDKHNSHMKKPLAASAPGSETNLLMAGIRRQRVRVSF